jgi:NADPH:quinone reductase-like Zn-dependent oxidoreductase
MRAIQISSFGNPTDVLELIDIPEPSKPDMGLALIGVEFAPINPNDLLLIKGTFHWTPSLPYLVGNEGVGRVLALGPRVSTVKVGDRVPLPLYSGTWRERVLVSARDLVARPKPTCSSWPCCGLTRPPLL